MVRVYPITPQSQFKNNSCATVPLSIFTIFEKIYFLEDENVLTASNGIRGIF